MIEMVTYASIEYPERKARPRRGDRDLAYWLLAPTLIVLVSILVVPLAYNLWLSVQQYNLLRPSKNGYVGLKNYVTILSSPAHLSALWLTVKFTAIAVTMEVLLGTVLALLLNLHFTGNHVVRTLILMPMLVSEVVAGLSWQLMFHTEFGLLNYLISLAGIPPQVWLGQGLAFSSTVVVEIWQHTPFVALIVLAGLQTIPKELTEAAHMDGASRGQRFRYIILPLLVPIILLALVFRTMFTLRVFTPIWVLTSGGPADATLVIGVDIYRTAFRYYDMGLASSLSIILLIVTLLITVVYMRLLRQEAVL
jgi:multiple sugar transport system permease protein